MPDRLFLSCWPGGAAAGDTLASFRALLELFPFSRLTRQPATFRILAVDRAAPAVFERGYAPPVPVEAILEAAGEFPGADCAYELDAWWDLWEPAENGWSLAPARVTLIAHAPEFEAGGEEPLRVELGPEARFLPGASGAEGLAMVRSNVRSLLKLAHDMDRALRAAKRELWSEAGGSFADRLREALAAAEAS